MRSVELILASASPRRKMLLEQIGYTFTIQPSHVEEPPFQGGDPAAYATSLAHLKASEIAEIEPASLIIGSDTIVVVDDNVLGKPVDRESAFGMLTMLSNRRHRVITAYSFHLKALGIQESHYVSTQVHFKHLQKDEMNKYIETGAPFDKAGAYGIQDYSSIFVDSIEGCFYNVVGLPLSDLDSKLKDLLSRHSLTLN